MLVGYNTCLGSIDVQERNWLFKGLFSLVDVSLKIRKEGFYLKLLILLVSGKDFNSLHAVRHLTGYYVILPLRHTPL